MHINDKAPLCSEIKLKKSYKVFRISAEKPSSWTWTCYTDSFLLLRQREKKKKEFQKKSANLLRCRAHWNPRGWNKFNYAFIDPAQKKDFNCLTKYSSFFHLLTLQPNQVPHTAGRCRETPQPGKIIHAGQRQKQSRVRATVPKNSKNTYRESKIISEISFLTKVLSLPEQHIKWSDLEREKKQSNNSLPGAQKIPEGEGNISESWMDLESSEGFECFPSRKTILDQLLRGKSLWFVIGVLVRLPPLRLQSRSIPADTKWGWSS